MQQLTTLFFGNTTAFFAQEITQSEFIRSEPTTPFFYFHSGLYFGMILMLLLVNLFFYFNLKDKIYLYYIFLVGSTNFVLAYHEGLLYPLVKNRFFTYDVDMISHYVQLIAGYLFFSKFVNLSKHYAKINTVLKYLLVIITLVYLGYFTNNNHNWIAWADNLGVSVFLFFWILSFSLHKKEPFTKLITLSFGVVIIAGFIHILFGGIALPVIDHTTNIVKLGAILEAIILTYATTYRTKILKEENRRIAIELQNYISKVLNLENSLQKINTEKESTKDEKASLKLVEVAKKHELTDREMDVFLYLAKGLNNQQIADQLFVSINTIKFHIRNIYEKMNVKKRSEITSKVLLDF